MDVVQGVPLLTALNWEVWKVEARVSLMHYGAWEFIEKGEERSPEEEAKLSWRDQCNFKLRKDRAFTLIYQSVSNEFKPLIYGTTDGAEAWKVLREHFESNTRVRIIQLLDEFFGTRYVPGENLGLFICRVKRSAKHLREVEHDLPTLYHQMIRSLPDDFRSTVQAIYQWSDKDFVPDKIEAKLLLEENHLGVVKKDLEDVSTFAFSDEVKRKMKQKSKFKSKNVNVNSNSKGKFSNQIKNSNVVSKNRKIGPCYFCNAYGHLISNCKLMINSESTKFNNENKNYKEAFNVEQKITFSELDCNLIELEANNSDFKFDKASWVFDTAATAHFCNNRNLFLTFEPVKNMQMSLAVGEKDSPVEGKGIVHFFVKRKNGIFNEIILKDLLYNPKLSRNLLSGVKLEKQGVKFKLVFFKTSKYKCIGNSRSVNVIANQVEKHDINELWHLRLCHVNNEYVVATSKNKSVHGLHELSGMTENCIPCKLSKSRRVSFKPIGEIRSKQALELLHMDLCGPLSVASHGDNRDHPEADSERDTRPGGAGSESQTGGTHTLRPCASIPWISKPVERKDRSRMDIYYFVEGSNIRLRSFNEVQKYCKDNNIDYDQNLFNFSGKNSSSGKVAELLNLPLKEKANLTQVQIPKTYRETTRTPKAADWESAMDKEMQVMYNSKVWNLIEPPKEAKVLGCRWVYSLKLNVNNAYLYARLDKKICMQQPEGYVNEASKCRLKLLLHVDDIVMFGETKKDLDNGITLLQGHFDLKILGKTILGIEFQETKEKLYINQSSYVEKLCKQYERFKFPVSSLPIPKGLMLSKLDCPSTPAEIDEMAKYPYRNLIGSLSFIAARTRPDIIYTVNILSQFQSNPGIKHRNSLLKLLSYLKYTYYYKLELSKISNLNLTCYSDLDYTDNRDDRVSIGGCILLVDETLISWRTFKQKCISFSTMEVEFVTLTEVAKELIWLKDGLENESLKLELNDSFGFIEVRLDDGVTFPAGWCVNRVWVPWMSTSSHQYCLGGDENILKDRFDESAAIVEKARLIWGYPNVQHDLASSLVIQCNNLDHLLELHTPKKDHLEI
ncbi:retrovirus-related Pol polyprotein from transposon TNT 1-94 [Trichonephila clavipes]|nr:retrovirus-related Pol polyprotein from transposon TNT 1-94 [Trichonephila clavipes]